MSDESIRAHAPVAMVPAAGADEDVDDSSYGWVMFYAFVSAVLAITFAVCVLALAPSWWVLGVVYGTDLIVTALVFKVVLDAFVSPAYHDLENAKDTSSAAPTEAAVIGLTAPRPTMPAHH